MLEEGFWRSAGDREGYARHLAVDAVHVFPGWGIVGRDQALTGVAAATPWEAFTIEEPHVVTLGDGAAALVYTAHAYRGGDAYRAAITSVYERRDGRWQLVLHQQTPLDA